MKHRRFDGYFRVLEMAALALILTIAVWLISPPAVEVMIYKLAVISGSGYLGYVLYRSVHADGSRVKELAGQHAYAAAILARAIHVGAGMLAGALTV